MDNIEVLIKLGLTCNEAKVFLSLNRIEKQTAKTISQQSGVAREVVYKALQSLKEKGFVEEILSSPKTFRTIPEEDAYAIMLHQKEKENKELKMKVQQTLRRKKETKEEVENANDEELVSFSPEKTNSRMKRGWTNAENSVDMIIPCNQFVRWGRSDLADYLDASLEKKVTVQIITDKETEKHLHNKEIFKPNLVQKIRCINFKFVDKIPEVEMVIFDKKHINIVLKKEEQLKDMHFLASNNPYIAEVANKYFENVWRKK